MNAFHPCELQPQGPVARRDGEIIAADFTVGSKVHSATLSISRIANGRREQIAQYEVAGKREARAVAAQLNAKPWNF